MGERAKGIPLMQLIWPEVLAEVRQLPVAATGFGLALGLLLWLFGWLGHRFWIVLLATAGAGVLGLYLNPVFGAKALLVGLLLATAAGLLALSLVRVVAFTAGGLALWLATRAALPAWDEPIIGFLVGGLLGVLLFRLWTMALTSFAGTILLTYFGLSLAERLAKLDAVALVENKAVVLNWVLAGATLVGLGLQLLLDRWLTRRRRVAEVVDEVEELEDERPRAKLGRRFYRRAG
jgi:MFS family permease